MNPANFLARLAPFVALAAACVAGCTAQLNEGVDATEADQASCASGHHECAAWGASCNGTTLETCVVGQDGCRKLLTQACALGCNAAASACNTCDALTTAKRSSSLSTPTAFYESLVEKGNVAIASWRGRDAQYTLPSRGFTAVDRTNPDALASLGTTTLPDNQDALELHVDGDRVLGLVPGSRLQIWDATNPSSLSPLGSYAPADPPKSLAVGNGLAYVGTDVGVDVVDVSNAAAPQMKSVVATSVPASAAAAAGSKVAVAGGSGVEIVDVSDPTQPKSVAKATFGATIYSYFEQPLAFDGQRLAVAGTTSWNDQLWTSIFTFELTPANELQARGTLTGLGSVTKLAFEGGDLVVEASDAAGTVDVSDLAQPKWKKHVFFGQGFQAATDVVRDGSMLYVSGTEGVSAIDLAKASDVTLHPLADADWLGGAATSGSIAYLARTTSGLVIEDVRDPKNPVVLSKTAMDATSIALDGYLAYVGVRDEGLRIYDVRAPWQPELVAQVTAPLVGNVSVSGGRAYAMCGIGYVCVFDVTQPSTPKLLVQSDAIVKTTGSSSAWTPFVMRGSHLYEQDGDALAIVDLADPSAASKIGEVTIGGGGYIANVLVALEGDHAYVAYDCHNVSGDTCVDVVDVANEASPRTVGTLSTTFAIGAGFYQTLNDHPRRSTAHVSGKNLFVTNEWGGVLVVDVSDPTSPKSRGEVWTFLPGREHFASDRFLTVFTESSFPFPAPEKYQDQVIELCQ